MFEFNDYLNNTNSKEALEDVIKSGLSPEILKLAGVKVFNGSKDELQAKLGFPIDTNGRIFIEFPYFAEDGSIAFYRYKVLPPIVIDDKEIKYLHPKNTPAIPYILPIIWEVKDKPNKPIWITEGEKKVLKLIQHGKNAIGLSGVWNFKAGKDSETSPENKSLFPELRVFNWRGRNVYLAFDMDLWTNPSVREALYILSLRLMELGAIIKIICWDLKKGKGIDDYLVYLENQGKDIESELTKLENSSKELRNFIHPDHWREFKKAIFAVNISGVNLKQIFNAIAKKKGVNSGDLWHEFYQDKRELQIKNTEVFTADEICKKEFKDVEWIIDGIIPKGLSILVGRPKIGKSWFILQNALKYTKHGPVLYIALEDTPRRLQSRMIDLGITEPPKNFYIVFNKGMFKINSDGIEQLEYLIKTCKAKFVVIDTFQRFRGTDKKGNTNIYSQDYEVMEKLKKIADEFDIGVVLLHHTKKGESDDPVELVSGTTGITGGADTVLVLKRGRCKDEATLFITGRDVEEKEYALKFIDSKWEFMGDIEEYRKSQVRQKIIDTFKEAGGPLSLKEIIDLTGLKSGTIKSALYRMVKDGEIIKPEKNKYGLPKNYIPEEIYETEPKILEIKNENLENVIYEFDPKNFETKNPNLQNFSSQTLTNKSLNEDGKNTNINNYETMKLFNGFPSSEEAVSTIGFIPKDSETRNQIETKTPVSGFTNKKMKPNSETVSSDEEKKAFGFTVSQNVNNNFFHPLKTQIQAIQEGYNILKNYFEGLEIEEVKPCKLCGSTIFWRNKLTNDVNCVKCHPPPDKDMVAGWIGNWLENNEITETQTDNKLVKIKSKTAGLTFLKDKWNLKEDLTLEEGKVYEVPLILANYLINERWAEILEYKDE